MGASHWLSFQKKHQTGICSESQGLSPGWILIYSPY